MTDEIERLAAARHEQHKNQASSRPMHPRYEETGIRAENWFKREFQVEPVWGRRPFDDLVVGDGGYDFVMEMWVNMTDRVRRTIDVKGTMGAPVLRVEEGKVKASVYVLIHVHDERGDGAIGWAWAREVLAAPVVVSKPPWNVHNHTILRRDLRSMREFRRRVSSDPF